MSLEAEIYLSQLVFDGSYPESLVGASCFSEADREDVEYCLVALQSFEHLVYKLFHVLYAAQHGGSFFPGRIFFQDPSMPSTNMLCVLFTIVSVLFLRSMILLIASDNI